MRKRQNIRSAARDAAVVLTSLAGSFLCVMLYVLDINSVATRSDGDIIASISFKRRIAQRSAIDTTVWDRLQQNTPLYNGDTIRTDIGSEAVITFNNNAVISLDESSIAQIFLNDQNNSEINFSGGSLVADSGSSGRMTVNTGGTSVSFDAGGSAALSAESADDPYAISTVSLRMISGGARYRTTECHRIYRSAQRLRYPGARLRKGISACFPRGPANMCWTLAGRALTSTLRGILPPRPRAHTFL